jgi:rhodanese-related sulfurtransferase
MAQFSQFIMNHWGLCLGLIVILILLFINELMAKKNQASEISPQAAVALINSDDAVVFDLRDVESFRKGHIINAIRANADEFSQPKMASYKDKTLILVCARGLQSQTLAATLRGLQFSNPLVLAGGMSAWQGADLPLVKGK